MTERERALTALRRGQPDRVPTFELVFHETERDFGGRVFHGTSFAPTARSGMSLREVYRHNARLYVDVARRYEHSIVYVTPLYGDRGSDLDRDVAAMIGEVRRLSGDEFCVMTYGDPTFKIPKDPANFAYALYDRPDSLHEEARRRVEAAGRTYDVALSAGADGIVMTSDYAMNSGPFLAPEHFAEFVTPYLTEAVRAAHERGLLVVKHSDGNLMPVLDQIVGSGIDGLHSIDPMAGMDIRQVKERWGARVCLCGNVHCAWMQTGTPEQITESAEYCLRHGKPGGGYVFATSNCVFRGMPLESYDLISGVWRKWRDYGRRA